jgi:hypothetical protein
MDSKKYKIESEYWIKYSKKVLLILQGKGSNKQNNMRDFTKLK